MDDWIDGILLETLLINLRTESPNRLEERERKIEGIKKYLREERLKDMKYAIYSTIEKLYKDGEILHSNEDVLKEEEWEDLKEREGL